MLNNSLAPSTLNSYRNAWKHYKAFHLIHHPHSKVMPISTTRLGQFISTCHHQNLSPSSVTSMISAISYVHKINNLPNPADSFLIKKLLHGMRRNQTKDKRLPFSLKDLTSIMLLLPSLGKSNYYVALYKAVILVAFFGLFRIGELTLSRLGHSNLIQKENVQIEHSDSKLTSISIEIKSFKHSAGRTEKIPLSLQPQKSICPVRALARYMRYATVSQGPLFQHPNGKPLTVSEFSRVLKKLVTKCHLDPNRYTCHSLRIGGATHAHLLNMPATQIQKLGRWKSSAFKKYIRIQPLAIST